MKTDNISKELQSRTIQSQTQRYPQGAYMEDNRNTAQLKLMDAIQRAEKEKPQFVDNRDNSQIRLMKAIQRMGMEEDEELQMKPVVQLQSDDKEPLQGKFETTQMKSNNTGLPDNLKSGIENISGFSMDDVRVHYNSAKPAQLKAHAYTQGADIHVASGQEKHLPHEAWHVVQQKQGRVQPTMQMQGVGVNNDTALEKEADDMGGVVLQRKITRAGAEIESKGVNITREDGVDIPKQQVIWGSPKIVVDTDNIEYVSDPKDNHSDFLDDIESGRAALCHIKDMAPGDGGVGKWEYGGEKYHLARTGSYDLAKPQVTFQIAKGTLSNFVNQFSKNSIPYRSGRNSDGTAFVGEDWPIWSNSIIDNNIKWGFTFINSFEHSENVDSAKALAKFAWFKMVFAWAQSNNTALYYKARFPIMPRTSIKDAYNQLEETSKTAYVAIMEKLAPKCPEDCVISSYGVFSHATVENYSIFACLKSTYDDSLAMDKGSRKVEITASDRMASTGDAGKSVGEMALPPDADGIFEIRGMPYIDVTSEGEVRSVYEDVLKFYSGKDDVSDSFND